MRASFFAAIATLALCSSPIYAQGVGKIDGRLTAKGLSGNDATNGQQLVWSSSLNKWPDGKVIFREIAPVGTAFFSILVFLREPLSHA